MGVDYTFVTFAGFVVPTDFLWIATTHTELRGGCGHVSWDQPYNFCRVCGSQAPKTVEVTHYHIRPELGLNESDINRNVVRGLPGQITVRYYEEISSPRDIILAGWELSTLSKYDPFHQHKPMPPINKAMLQSALEDRNIPYDPESFGLHVMVIAS